MTSRRTLAATTLAVALIATLAACDGGGAEPSPTPSVSAEPSPTSSERDVLEAPEFDIPASAEAASADAQESAEAAHAAITQVELAGGEGVDALSQFLSGPPLNSTLANIEAIQVGDATVTGTASFNATSAVVNDLTRADGATVPFGSAVVTGCVDYSDYSVVGNDGVPVAWPNGGRFEIDYGLEFLDDARWIVVEETATGLPCDA